jgi:hypothetical protein
MKIFQTKIQKLPGTDYSEVYPQAFAIFKDYKRKTKRRPHVRSAYFNKEKIFLDYFWEHLHQKNSKDRVRRLKFYPCALELIKNSRAEPITKENPNKRSEILHRFAGATPEKELFFVQINEDKRTNKKFLLSVFPEH